MKISTIFPVIREMHTSYLPYNHLAQGDYSRSAKMAALRFIYVIEDAMNVITKIQLRKAQSMLFS